jgi:nucleoside-diphosphate-sugar epimerase
MKAQSARPLRTTREQTELTVCLVAGGAGFVGSHLCESLLGQNCFVYCLDNFSTGRETNIAGFKDHGQFELLDHDLNGRQKLNLPRQVDYIFHVAGVEAYSNGLDVSLDTLLVNSFGTKTLLELAKEHQAKFLLASSEQVYGGFVSETNVSQYFGASRSLEAEGAFAEAKRFAEALTFEYGKKHQVNARIVRLDFLYGPRMNLESGSIIAKLFSQSAKEKQVTVPGNGLTRLYPTYITDAVYGLVKAMFSQSSNGRVYGLINPQMMTILNFAYLIRDQGDSQIAVKLGSGEDLYNFEFPEKGVLDSQELLGWYPKVEAREGVKVTWDWLASQTKPTPPAAEWETKSRGKTRAKQAKGIEKTTEPTVLPPILTQQLPQKEAPQEPPGEPNGRFPSFITPGPVSKVAVGLPAPSAPKVAQIKAQPTQAKRSYSWRWPTLSLSFLKPRHMHWWIVGLCLTLVAVLLPVAVFAFSTYRAVEALKQTQQAIVEGEVEHLGQFSYQARQNFGRSRQFLQALSWITTQVGLRRQTQLADQFLRTGEHLADSTTQLAEAGKSGQKLMVVVLGRETGDPKQEMQTLRSHLDAANNQLGFAEAELEGIPEPLFQVKTLEIGKNLQLLKAQLPQWRRQLTEAQQALAIVPAILESQEKQTYLVLLQNNQELRPTGGFIGSFALLTIEKGKILDFRVEDSYTADGQLKGYVEPPEVIKKHLGEDIWWFRDSNISPDFPTSAARAAWFIQKEMDREVAGVIGVNLQLVQNLLQAMGPIYVSDYQEQITAENVFERAEYHSEVNFFPGSTQKKDFLGSLSRALFENIRQLESGQLAGLAQATVKSLNERALMVWLPGAKEASLLDQYGWDGALREPPTGLPEFGTVELADYLMPVEANFGVNKANYFVRRSSNHEVAIQKNGEVKETFTLTLTNTSTSEAWPGGRYKNYLRLYLPQDVRLDAVRASKQRGQEGDIIKSKDLDIGSELGKRVVGFLIEVPPLEEREVTVEYHRRVLFPVNDPEATYVLYWQKQAGIGTNPIQITLTYPLFLKPTKLSQEAARSGQSLTVTTDSAQDRVFAVTFSH